MLDVVFFLLLSCRLLVTGYQLLCESYKKALIHTSNSVWKHCNRGAHTRTPHIYRCRSLFLLAGDKSFFSFFWCITNRISHAQNDTINLANLYVIFVGRSVANCFTN